MLDFLTLKSCDEDSDFATTTEDEQEEKDDKDNKFLNTNPFLQPRKSVDKVFIRKLSRQVK